MQTTSATWQSLWAAGAALEARAVINGTTYTDISAPRIDRALMQQGLTIGNTVSATCRFSIRDPGTIPRSAEVVMSMRLNDGETQSEWLPVGTYYISHRQTDPVTGMLALECYDAMLKANAIYITSGTYPKRMREAVNDIAAAMGVTVDARTSIENSDYYAISMPDGDTAINTILSDIGAACGGNWIITPNNQLRLVTINRPNNNDTVTVDGVIGSISVGAPQTITGLRVVDEDGDYVYGDDTGVIVTVDTPYINDTVLATLHHDICNRAPHQPFILTDAIYDPAAELGDYISAGANGEISSVLCGESATLGAAFRGSITAPEPAEVGDEYPYIGEPGRNEKAIQRLKTLVTDSVEAVNAQIENLSVSDIKAGIIHSADYSVETIAKIYPASGIYPSATTFANNGERVITGFAIDFSTGQIYGALYSEQIAALQSALVYPKSAT